MYFCRGVLGYIIALQFGRIRGCGSHCRVGRQRRLLAPPTFLPSAMGYYYYYYCTGNLCGAMAVPNLHCGGTALFKQAILSSKPLQILKFHNNSSTISSLSPQSSAFSSSTNMLRCPFGLARGRRFHRYIFYSSAQGYSSFSGSFLGQKKHESGKGLHLKSKVRPFAFNLRETSHWVINLSRFRSIAKSLNHGCGPSVFIYIYSILCTHTITYSLILKPKVNFVFLIHETFAFFHIIMKSLSLEIWTLLFFTFTRNYRYIINSFCN